MSIKSRRRRVPVGMTDPTNDYSPQVVAQMQDAINRLARELEQVRQKAAAIDMVASVRANTSMSDDSASTGGTTAVPLPGQQTPSPVVATDPWVGQSGRYSREGHSHQGQPYQRITGSGGGLYVDGTLAVMGFGPGTSMWCHLGGTWVCFTHVADDLAAEEEEA